MAAKLCKAEVKKIIIIITSLAEFKTKIKTWKAPGCTCRLCKTYIQNVGYIN